eukprot:616741-Rhodomonas_salina.1
MKRNPPAGSPAFPLSLPHPRPQTLAGMPRCQQPLGSGSEDPRPTVRSVRSRPELQAACATRG